MRSFVFITVLCAALGSGVCWATPLWITTNDGAGADAFVQGGSSAEQNFGANEHIVVKNGELNDMFARNGYLRFDLSATSGGAITSATLALTVSANNSGGGNPAPADFTVDVFGLVDGFAGVDNNANSSTADDVDIHDEFWPESVIDWNSAPANVTTSGSALDANALLLGTLAVSSSDVVGSTVFFSSAALVNFLNADSNDAVTLILRRSGANAGGPNNLAFASKENATYAAPALELNAVIPEPATWALVALAAPALLLLHRRRRN